MGLNLHPNPEAQTAINELGKAIEQLGVSPDNTHQNPFVIGVDDRQKQERVLLTIYEYHPDSNKTVSKSFIILGAKKDPYRRDIILELGHIASDPQNPYRLMPGSDKDEDILNELNRILLLVKSASGFDKRQIGN